MKLQPHSDQCKKRMAEILQGDARAENAKRRAKDYQRKKENEDDTDISVKKDDMDTVEKKSIKRTRLKEIEDELDTTTGLDKRNQLYKDYMHAYQEDNGEKMFRWSSRLGRQVPDRHHHQHRDQQ